MRSKKVFSFEKEIFSQFESLSHSTQVGFEKESLRINNHQLSRTSHPKKLGSALYNRYITTDFSEAQLELVTPPLEHKEKAINFLEDTHHFISHNLDDEIIWPFSMPITIKSEADIPIAKYGKTNLAKFKEIYRSGLSKRYGKMMQSISGFHYNYSVPKHFWESALFDDYWFDDDHININSYFYFNQLRNIFRLNWLVIYLFGASPIVSKFFLDNEKESFKKIDSETLYLPNSTSLRMSSYGYQNKRRKNFHVSYNSISKYILDLIQATNTPHPEFKKIDNNNGSQLNQNILQIDDEYYAAARAKSSSISNIKTTSKLSYGGVDFIELRSLDLDPFSRIGINKETIQFLEVFLAYCFIKQSDNLESKEIKNIDYNDEIVAIKGREPDLKIVKDNCEIELRVWGNILLNNLLPVAAILDDDENSYTAAVNKAKEKINNPNLTLSARLLDEAGSGYKSFMELGIQIGNSNKEYYLDREKSENKNWKLLEREAEDSIKQDQMQEKENKSFDEFLEDYFNS